MVFFDLNFSIRHSSGNIFPHLDQGLLSSPLSPSLFRWSYPGRPNQVLKLNLWSLTCEDWASWLNWEIHACFDLSLKICWDCLAKFSALEGSLLFSDLFCTRCVRLSMLLFFHHLRFFLSRRCWILEIFTGQLTYVAQLLANSLCLLWKGFQTSIFRF